ncbi:MULTISPECIES: thiolase family protein [Geobacillus]|uniref:Thiolase family protein n=1 Tax=Geobacillus zalihae TaxID=213419 RepID=A0A1V9CQ85_9BACL|nr:MULTISPECIES: thiolase family protein [Geobacillus]ATA60992.1 Acetyl-CoA acetyltransferase [Geobacillus stearothermophilus]AGE23365.1 acetyl-CoA C-acyltransferase [Geobacillus sp. GHH01]OQP16307.1 acetyl-CoA acetyltransferase [Geobacillus zalihae]OQP23777.1 acetyl-CoA acetyltransferase [Geobacillus zalihae]QNU16828.1 thiolase family protein [Geobacillus zalihae]
MREVVIVDAVRTAIGKKKGALSSVHPVDLLVPVLRALVDRNGLDAGLVEDVIVGCVTMTGEQGGNIARQAVLAAGFPVGVPAFSLNRMCGSSQQAIHSAAQAILAGDIDIAIAAGVESMTRVPMGSDMGRFSRQLTSRYNIVPQGISAEMIAKKWGVSREELDAFSLQSHEKAAAATDRGMFEREIIPLDVPGEEGTVSFTRDEGIRRDTSLEKLAALKPSFQPKDGVITAGNSSQVSDGAAGVLLMSAEKAAALGLRPRARIVARTVVGEDPILMLTGVIPATRRVLDKAGLRLDDIDVIEINEAFASVVKAWERELEPDMAKVNPRGGAIALGHPLGASGARLMTTLLHELEDMDGKYGLQVMCIGFGMATATIIERL